MTQRMNLLEVQREMASAVMTPLTADERMRNVAPGGRSLRAVASKIIKPNDRLSSFERLEIYNRQYWFRVLSGFAEDFPGLRAVLGTRAFDKLAEAYLKDCPSRSFTMRNIGSQLESWLTQHPERAGLKFKLAVDMVRLEWADINAFDGTRETPITTADLAQADPAKLRLRLQPYISLLDLRYPVDDLLLEIKKHTEELSVASNAFSERHKTKRIAAVARMKPGPIFLAVHRMGEEVYFRRLEAEEFAILSLLRDGKSLNAAVETGLRNSAAPVEERPLLVQKWFQTWSTLGWFCPVTKNSTRS